MNRVREDTTPDPRSHAHALAADLYDAWCAEHRAGQVIMPSAREQQINAIRGILDSIPLLGFIFELAGEGLAAREGDQVPAVPARKPRTTTTGRTTP